MINLIFLRGILPDRAGAGKGNRFEQNRTSAHRSFPVNFITKMTDTRKKIMPGQSYRVLNFRSGKSAITEPGATNAELRR